MATLAITPDQDAISGQIFIAAPPARVFSAITDPTQLRQWWGQEGMYRTTNWEGEFRPGGSWRSSGVGADGTEFSVTGEYLEIDPPRLLVYTWLASWHGPEKTTVRWELTPQGSGTLLKIQHTGFAGNVKAVQDHGQGWHRVLGWMQAFVEKGETIDSRGFAIN